MDSKKEITSRFKFLWIEITFLEKEKVWYKIVVILIALITLIVSLMILKEFALPAIGFERLSHFKLSLLTSFLKSKQ